MNANQREDAHDYDPPSRHLYCDFVPAVTEQLPVRVFLKLMGLPEDWLSEFRTLVQELLALSGDPMARIGRIRKIAAAMTGVILERRWSQRILPLAAFCRLAGPNAAGAFHRRQTAHGQDQQGRP